MLTKPRKTFLSCDMNTTELERRRLSSEIRHIRATLRYFPHDEDKHAKPSETAFVKDQYTVAIENCLDAYGKRYNQIRCLRCNQCVRLPQGYDWEDAWRLSSELRS